MAKEFSGGKSESIRIKFVGLKAEVYVSPAFTSGEQLIFKRGEVKTLSRAEWSERLAKSSGFEEVHE